MSQPPPGRTPVALPFKAYAVVLLWSTIAVAGVVTVIREIAYVQATNDPFWTFAPAVLSVICVIQIIAELQALHRQRHPATQP